MIDTSAFVNTGLDEATVSQVDPYTTDQSLIKAMSKQGLVQKEVTVKGKNGKTFTRKQWVKAGEADKGDSGTKAIKDALKEHDLVGVIDALKQLPNGTVLKTGRKDLLADPPYETESTYVKLNEHSWQFNPQIKDKDGNFAFSNIGTNKLADHMLKVKGNSKFNLQVTLPEKTDSSKPEANDTKEDTKAENKKFRIQENYDYGKARITANTYNDLVAGIESMGLKVAPRDKTGRPQKRIGVFSADGERHTIEITQYFKGDYETYISPDIANQKPKKAPTDGSGKEINAAYFGFRGIKEEGAKPWVDLAVALNKVSPIKSHRTGMAGHGEFHLENGETVGFGESYNRDTKESKVLLQWHGQQFDSAEDLADLWNGKRKADNKTEKSKPEAKDAKTDSSKKLSKEDAKKKTQTLTSDVNKDAKSRNEFMSKVKGQGITWKENDNPGINWMRCCMALNAHFQNGGEFTSTAGSSLSTKELRGKSVDSLKKLYRNNKSSDADKKIIMSELNTRGVYFNSDKNRFYTKGGGR